MNKKIYAEALKASIPKLSTIFKSGRLQGLENIIQENLAAALKKQGYEPQREIPLKQLAGENLWKNDGKPKVDIVIDNNHGIEVKVIRLPNNKHASPNQRLYDIGQISSDYWRLKNAKMIKKAEIGILLCGPLISDLKTPFSVIREFHNRMFLDFLVSKKYGELSRELTNTRSPMYSQRKKQTDVIREIGFTQPFDKLQHDWIAVVNKDFAYISIPIKK